MAWVHAVASNKPTFGINKDKENKDIGPDLLKGAKLYVSPITQIVLIGVVSLLGIYKIIVLFSQFISISRKKNKTDFTFFFKLHVTYVSKSVCACVKYCSSCVLRLTYATGSAANNFYDLLRKNCRQIWH